jgi:hypothetical protein
MTIAQWIITAGAVVGALGIIFRTLVKPVVSWARRIEKAVSTVEQNMNNNGGSSLRDAIDRIERRLNEVEEIITKPKK